jgi:hypothetical protein
MRRVQNQLSQIIVIQVQGPRGLESRSLLPHRSITVPEDQISQDIVDKAQAGILLVSEVFPH